ncbi:FAD-dependent oxidoreductase, partial [Burkholderia multivorans]
SFIWGVWHDAKYLADQIGIQRMYRDFTPASTHSDAQPGNAQPGSGRTGEPAGAELLEVAG